MNLTTLAANDTPFLIFAFLPLQIKLMYSNILQNIICVISLVLTFAGLKKSGKLGKKMEKALFWSQAPHASGAPTWEWPLPLLFRDQVRAYLIVF